jgi:hypothetical protein
LEMDKYRLKKEKKGKREIGTEEVYRMLELLYRKLGEGNYKGRLSRPATGYRGGGGGSKVSPKLNPRSYQRPRSYATTEPKYNPKPEKSSYGGGGGKSSEPTIYRPSEKVVYDPEVKGLLQKIEKHLTKVLPEAEKPKQDAEHGDLDKLDVEELTKILEEGKDPEVLKKLLEKELAESNEEEPVPNLYKPEKAGQQDVESKPETEVPAEPDKENVEVKEEGEASEKEAEPLSAETEQEGVEELSAIEQEPIEPLLEEAEAIKPEVQPEALESSEAEVKSEVELALEPVESELFDTKPGVLPEDLNDPVFWNKVETEVIEKDLRPKIEPEPLDEYGY